MSGDAGALREQREHTLYRLLLRGLRTETDELAARVRARGYPDMLPSYPRLLANLDTEGTRITALAEKVGVTRQAMSQRVQDIEARGYVERRPDPDDARAVIVAFTAKGRNLLRDALDVVAEVEGEYAAIVGSERLVAAKQTLLELLDHIDPIGRLSLE